MQHYWKLVCSLVFALVITACAHTQQTQTLTTLANENIKQTISIGAGQSVLLHKIANFPTSRAAALVSLADRSTCSQSPLSNNCNGLIEPGDRVVVTNRFILWFDLTRDTASITNGEAGFLRGIWTIYCCDGSGQVNFAHIENANNWAPNELLPGASGGLNQGSGMSVQMRLINNIDTPDPFSMGAENADNVSLVRDGVPINQIDTGLFSSDGVMYQTQAYLEHFERSPTILSQNGFANVQDVNNSPTILSRIQFTLTYRIAPDARYFRQEISLKVTDNPTSVISSYVMSAGIFGPTSVGTDWGWSVSHTRADVGRIRLNAGQQPAACNVTATVAANTTVEFNRAASNGGLDYFMNANAASPGNTVYLTATPRISTGRTIGVRRVSGFIAPLRIQAILNGYNSAGNANFALDTQYVDINQPAGCKNSSSWAVGYTHTTANEYFTEFLP
jgi:hypothetical protein